MANYFKEAGLRTAAVHSGPSSAPRTTTIKNLEKGNLDILFSVDMFNEGVDLPNVDTVMMLRPTESSVVWIQQFGRGLRKLNNEKNLTVIDYIGNHRIFLIKPKTLFGLESNNLTISQTLKIIEAGQMNLPPGCEVTYDLESIKILNSLIPKNLDLREALKNYYEEFRELHGQRPTALEVMHVGYAPRSVKKNYGSWIQFVQSMGDFTQQQSEVMKSIGDFLVMLEITPMSKSYKMVTLLAMLNHDELPGSLSIESLTDTFAMLASRSAELRTDTGSSLSNPRQLRKLLEENPINAWASGSGTRNAQGQQYFAYDGNLFKSVFDVPSSYRTAFQELVREMNFP